MKSQGIGTGIQSTSFDAPGSAQAVEAFYVDALTQDGWKRVKTTAPTKIEFDWASSPDQPAYTLRVTLSELSPTKTYVELELLKYTPH